MVFENELSQSSGIRTFDEADPLAAEKATKFSEERKQEGCPVQGPESVQLQSGKKLVVVAYDRPRKGKG